MERIMYCGEKYLYDERFWEEIVVPFDVIDLFEKEVCPISLHYVGPIVDGKITTEVPRIPMMYGMFENCAGLTEPPKFTPTRMYQCFKGCAELNPSLEWVEFWDTVPKSGVVGNVFQACGSAKIFSYDRFYNTWLSGVPEPVIAIASIAQAGGMGVHTEEVKSLIAEGRKSLQQICDGLIDYSLEEFCIVTENGNAIVSRKLKNSSECKSRILACNSKVIISTNGCIEEKLEDSTVYVDTVGEDFILTDSNSDLTRYFGWVLKDQEFNETINVGNGGILRVYGENTVDAECPITGEGEITIIGDGTLNLVSRGINPCIGVPTKLKKESMGWSPSKNEVTRIIVDGVKVVCSSSIANFSLGSYGKAAVPEVVELNGGVLECPESKGVRVLKGGDADGLQLRPVHYSIRK